MSFHNNFESWLKMTDSQHCPVCQNLPMPPDMVDIAERPYSWLSAEPNECMRGACHITAKKHVIELFELNDDEMLGLMKDVRCYAQALKQVTGAVKINYEIHGNSLPHLHIHLYPRTMDDPFPGQSIDYRQKVNQYTDGEFETFVSAMRKEIDLSSR